MDLQTWPDSQSLTMRVIVWRRHRQYHWQVEGRLRDIGRFWDQHRTQPKLYLLPHHCPQQPVEMEGKKPWVKFPVNKLDLYTPILLAHTNRFIRIGTKSVNNSGIFQNRRSHHCILEVRFYLSLLGEIQSTDKIDTWKSSFKGKEVTIFFIQRCPCNQCSFCKDNKIYIIIINFCSHSISSKIVVMADWHTGLLFHWRE